LLLLADRAGHRIDSEKLIPGAFLGAMIESFSGNEAALAEEIARMIAAD
jgi:cell filamentation protein